MSLGGSCHVAGPSHRPPGGGPLPTCHPPREWEFDTLRAAILS